MPSVSDVEAATALAKSAPAQAVEKFRALLAAPAAKTDEDAAIKETSLLRLGELFRDLKRPDDLAALVRSSHPLLQSLAKAKAAKIIRTLIDLFSDIPGAVATQVEVCKEAIQWAVTENRIFLRQSLETRLCALYLDNKLYTESLALISNLLKELKRLDDKNVLVEVQLLESRVFHALKNIAKSRASLTSARTSANSIYCPPLMQAGLDMQSGILHAEEKDYKTAFSYFYETLESYASQDDRRAVPALKYMLLCKVMLGLTDDVQSILNSKIPQRYPGSEVDALKAVATAYEHRSLQEFEQALARYKDELGGDQLVRTHLTLLYDTLLEQNLLRIIEPYSRVEITHVASLVKLPTAQVEAKLSQMILDKVFRGVLDQGTNSLEVFDETHADKTYDATLETIKNMGTVVESLYGRAAQLGH